MKKSLIFPLTATLLALPFLSLSANAASPTMSKARSYYCIENNFPNAQAWEVNFQNNEVKVEGYFPSIQKNLNLTLKKDTTLSSLAIPQGSFESEQDSENFELSIFLAQNDLDNPFQPYGAIYTYNNESIEAQCW